MQGMANLGKAGTVASVQTATSAAFGRLREAERRRRRSYRGVDIKEMVCGLRKEEFWHVCADRRSSGGEDRRLWGRRQGWCCGVCGAQRRGAAGLGRRAALSVGPAQGWQVWSLYRFSSDAFCFPRELNKGSPAAGRRDVWGWSEEQAWSSDE